MAPKTTKSGAGTVLSRHTGIVDRDGRNNREADVNAGSRGVSLTEIDFTLWNVLHKPEHCTHINNPNFSKIFPRLGLGTAAITGTTVTELRDTGTALHSGRTPAQH